MSATRLIRRATAAERGVTLLETLLAATILLFGIVATVGVFGSSKASTLSVYRYSVGARQAQAALEKMGNRDYARLVLSRAPDPSRQPPGSTRLSEDGSELRVFDPPADAEELVINPDPGAEDIDDMIDPGPETLTVGSGGTAVQVEVYRYVTWRNETCRAGADTICPTNRDTKRLIVAVAVTSSTGRPLRPVRPIWLSRIVTDEAQGAPDPGGSGTPVPVPGDQSFYLYDTPCGWSSRQAQIGDHPTRDTAARGSAAADSSYCWNSNVNEKGLPLQPDLMGTELPPDVTPKPPKYRYSDDVDLSGAGSPGIYNYGPGGIALLRSGAECLVDYPSPATATADRYKVHAWATPTFETPFNLSGKVYLDVYTGAEDAAPGRGVLCISLLSRREVAGEQAEDRLLGQFVCNVSRWRRGFVPRGEDSSAQVGMRLPRRKRCRFSLTEEKEVPAGSRLVLALSVLNDPTDESLRSANNLIFFYDHQDYKSALVVGTFTPLGAGG